MRVVAVAVLTLVAAAASAAPSGSAEAPETGRQKDINVSVVRSISTNGRDYAATDNWVGLGVLASNGRTLRAYGLSLGGLHYRDMDGWSTALGYVWSSGRLRGVSTAGALAYAEDARGVQLALGGAAARRARGLQAAGATTVCLEHCQGAQVAAVNVAERIDGLQLGALNLGRHVRGMQLGLINIARDSDFSLGLVNVIYGVPARVSLTTNEWSPVNVALKLGSRYLYNQLQVGYAFSRRNAPARWSAGYGLGLRPLVGRRVSFQIELLGGAYLADTPDLSSNVKGGLFASLSAPVVFQLRERFALLVGPQLTVLHGRVPTPRVPFPTIVSRTTDSDGTAHETKFWPGLTAGIQL